MAHTYSCCLVHYVFSTKGRRKTLSDDLRKRLWPYMGGIARQNSMKALAVGGTDDHAHVLLSLPPTLSLAKAIQLIKGGSSRWVHETFPSHSDFAWQQAYGAFSIGVSGIEETVRYIESQERHHRTRSFEEEFVAFLRRHGLEFDQEYVWG